MSDLDPVYGDGAEAFDPVSFIQAGRRRLVGEAVAAKPDEVEPAARAYELSRVTGDKPALIAADLDNYETQHRAALTSNLLHNNDWLREYLDADPMRAKLSADDWANLDEFTSKLEAFRKYSGFPTKVAGGAFDKALEGFKHGFGEGPIGGWVTEAPFLKDNRAAQAIWATSASPIEVIFRTLGGGIHGATEAVFSITKDLTGSDQLARDIAGMAENQLTGVGVHGVGGAISAPLRAVEAPKTRTVMTIRGRDFPFDPQKALDRIESDKYGQALARAKLWIDAGLEPPAGLHPEIDKIKEKQNDLDVKRLEEATVAAEASATRERDPQTFADLVRLRDRGTIEIDGEAVARLYGDKPPSGEDGLLGWVPRIGEQLELARASGGDISIPLADWLAYADGDLMRLLRDDIRVRPGGITKNEALRSKGASEEEINAARDEQATDLASKTAEGIEEAGTATPEEQGRADIARTGEDRAKAAADPIAEEFLKAQRTREIIAEDLPSVRAAGGLEPLFSIGDRKLNIKSRPHDPKIDEYSGVYIEVNGKEVELIPDHFRLEDENGMKVGFLDVVPLDGGKKVFVGNVGGLGGHGPNSFGPSLTRDLFKQLKKQYPDAEEVGGYRISGAREKAGTTRLVWMKFNEELDQQFKDFLEAAWQKYEAYPNIEALIKPNEAWSGKERAIAEAIKAEVDRLTPGVATEVVHAIARKDQPGHITGTYLSHGDFGLLPKILVSLDGTNPVGVTRHEAIHALRNLDLFTATEWQTLERAAREQGWIKRFRVEERYPTLDQRGKLEEAIADGFKYWKEGEVVLKDTGAFQKMKDFFEALYRRIKEIIGRDFTWEELFQETDIGRVGRREPGEGEAAPNLHESVDMAKDALERARDRDNEADILNARGRSIVYDRNLARKAGVDVKSEEYAGVRNALGKLRERIREIGQEPKFSVEEPELPAEGTTRIEDRPLFRTPGTIGMSQTQARLYERRLREMHEADVEWTQAKAEREQKRQQTAEWRTEKKNTLAEVEADFDARPDVAADLFFARGELYGEKVERLKIDPADLKALGIDAKALPRDYLAKPDGAMVDLDDLASLTGYPTGRALIEDLVRYNEAKLAANMSAKAFRDRLVGLEVDRRMTQRFGDLEENIRDAALDQVAGETQLNLIAEETLALGIRAGAEASINKAELREWIKERFEESPMAGESAEKYLRASGKKGTEAELALLKEEFDKAYRAKQGQYMAVTLMREARTLEREQKAFAKLAKRLGKREVKGLDQEFHDWIGTLLWQANVPGRRSPLEIQRSQAITGAESFPEFIERITGDGWAPEVGPEILAGRVKPIDTMTVGEFRDFKAAIDSLNYIGRQVEKINIEGEKRDFAEYRDGVLRNITSRPQRPRESQEKGLAHRIFQADAELTRIEVWLKELDLGEEMGPLVNTVIRPMAEAKHKEYSLQEQLAKDIKALPQDKAWKRTLTQALPNDWFLDPSTGEPFKMTRGDLINVMLNWGNRSNRQKLANYGSPDPLRGATRAERDAWTAQMDAYIHQHATAQDWAFVQGVWNIYKGFQKDMEIVWRNTSGTQPKLVEAVPVASPHGTFEGGYFPLLRDWYLSGTPKVVSERALFGPDYPNYATPQGHLKERTGASYFVDFRQDIGMIPIRMQQVMHDIAYRDAVMAAQKVISDRQITAAIRQHYGVEYEKQLRPWLERIAKGATMDEKNLNFRDRILRGTRMNLINYALPLNYVVTLTPDIGAPTIRTMVNYWPNRAANLELANRWSKEIPHAIYNMDRDFRESMQRAVGEGKIDTAKQKAVLWGYKIVSSVSREFRTATWVDKFQKALGEGHDEAKAAAIADSYVRERHGSAALADLPPIMAGGEAGRLLTMFYGYWNTQLNWLRTVKGDVARGEYMKALETAYGTILIGSLFGALVANQAREEDTAVKRLVKAVPLQLLGMMPYGVREFGTYMVEGVPPSTPLGSLIKSVGATSRDVVKYFRKEPVDKGIRHATATAGLVFGVPGTLQIGRTAQGLYDVSQGSQRPRDIYEWTRLMMTGEARLKRQGER